LGYIGLISSIFLELHDYTQSFDLSIYVGVRCGEHL
jgi:hypothetical protein